MRLSDDEGEDEDEEPGDRRHKRPARCDCPPARDPDGLACWACQQRGFDRPNVIENADCDGDSDSDSDSDSATLVIDEDGLGGPAPLPETTAYSRVGEERIVVREVGNASEAWIATSLVVSQEDVR